VFHPQSALTLQVITAVWDESSLVLTLPQDCARLCSGLSMQVGGTGLTVTGANRVILVDPAWNPSADAQAIDRVHRIGQKQEAGFMLCYSVTQALHGDFEKP